VTRAGADRVRLIGDIFIRIDFQTVISVRYGWGLDLYITNESHYTLIKRRHLYNGHEQERLVVDFIQCSAYVYELL